MSSESIPLPEPQKRVRRAGDWSDEPEWTEETLDILYLWFDWVFERQNMPIDTTKGI